MSKLSVRLSISNASFGCSGAESRAASATRARLIRKSSCPSEGST